VADVVGQSAVQFTDAHGIVHGDGRHFLRPHHVGAEEHEHQQHQGKYSFHIHNHLIFMVDKN
jgi:hypothetical protein